MRDLTIKIDPSQEHMVKEIERSVGWVLADANPKWAVTVLKDADNGNWNVGAQPGDEQPFHGELTPDHQTPEAIQDLIIGWYEQYKEWMLDA